MLIFLVLTSHNLHIGRVSLNNPIVFPETITDMIETREQVLLGNIGKIAELINVLLIVLI